MMLEFKNKLWEPQVFAICMAYDAFRIALGGKPQHFTLKEVVTWLEARARFTRMRAWVATQIRQPVSTTTAGDDGHG